MSEIFGLKYMIGFFEKFHQILHFEILKKLHEICKKNMSQ